LHWVQWQYWNANLSTNVSYNCCLKSGNNFLTK
jgi:hypothetical protein